MPEKWTHSIRFVDRATGKDVVQIGDASGRWLVIPCDDYVWVQYVIDALNLMDRSEKIVPQVTQALVGPSITGW